MKRIAVVLALMISQLVSPASADEVTVDHILWAVPDLAAGAAQFEALSGVTPVFGGVHPGVGTANNLVSLGPRTYLEIIGPNPDAPDERAPRVDAIRLLSAATLQTFAISSPDIDGLAAAAKEFGLETFGPTAGSRAKPDGEMLHWRALGLGGHDFGAAIPFVIDWGTSTHPATTSPLGAELTSLIVMHPRAGALRKVYAALGIPVEVIEAEKAEFAARISTPNGEITLRGPISENPA